MHRKSSEGTGDCLRNKKHNKVAFIGLVGTGVGFCVLPQVKEPAKTTGGMADPSTKSTTTDDFFIGTGTYCLYERPFIVVPSGECTPSHNKSDRKRNRANRWK